MKRRLLILSILIVAGTSVSCGVKLISSGNVKSGEEDAFLQSRLNYIYETTGKYFAPCIYLDHFLPSGYRDSLVFFDNGMHALVLEPLSSVKGEKTVSVGVRKGENRKCSVIKFVRRIVPESLTKKKKPRVLVIGDSVTSGYGSSSNKIESWHPNQYWAYAKMFFEMETIDNCDKADEFDVHFLGSGTNGSFTIRYKNVERPVRAMAEGYGGASLEQLFEPVLGNAGKDNPFYNSTTGTFSLLTYLSRYRTMDDNGGRLMCADSIPAGKSVVGSDGKSYIIGTEITSQELLKTIDVCSPSILVLNLCHNTSLENFKKNIGIVVATVRGELPDTKIVIMTIDEAGTLFSGDYPEYKVEKVSYGGLHDKNASIYNYVKGHVEKEADGIYLLGAQFVMPTMDGYPTVGKDGIYEENPAVLGPHYHPNNKAHEAWGYALYAMIKWIAVK